jgi:hypothetical protein
MNKVKIIFLTLSFFAAVSTLQAATIRIRVLDGRNGKPITNEVLQIWINEESNGPYGLPTGKDGVAMLEVPAGGLLWVHSNWYVDCRPYTKEARASYSVDDIISFGIVAGNRCGKRSFEARRGELILFVRPLHWWEGLKL